MNKNKLIILITIGLLVWLSYLSFEQVKSDIQELEQVESNKRLLAFNITKLSIENYLSSLHDKINNITYKHNKDLSLIIANPDKHEELLDQIQTEINIEFPSSFSSTLTDNQGTELVVDFNGEINEMCQVNLLQFAQSNKFEIRIHPNTKQYHFDMIIPYHNLKQNFSGLFFTSFKATRISEILKAGEDEHNQLLIVLESIPNLIEIMSTGDRTTLERGFHLDDDEILRISLNEKINNTSWHLINLPSKKTPLSVSKNKLIVEGIIKLLILYLVIFVLIYSIYKSKKIAALLANRKAYYLDNKFNHIINNSTDAILSIDEHHKITFLNHEAEKLFGYNNQELLGQDLNILLPERIHSHHLKDVHNFRDSNEKKINYKKREKQLDILGKHKQGYEFPVDIAISKTKSFDEQWVFTAFIRDISQEKALESQLIEAKDKLEIKVAKRTASLDLANSKLQHEINERIKAEEQLHLSSSVFEYSSEAIIITDANALVMNCNKAYTRITGYRLEEIKGKNPSFSKSGRHDKPFYMTMWDTINRKGAWTGEIWDRRKNGTIFPKRLSINAVLDSENVVSHYIGVFMDMTDIKATEKKLENIAFMDALTGLPNRQLFHDRLSQELSHAFRQKTKLALLFIDLDQFKRVNDTLGHHIGDELLQEIAQRIKNCVRQDDTVARLGGDEFTIILTNLSSPNTIIDIANKIIDKVRQVVILNENELFVGASIGISIYPDDSQEQDILIRSADAAMYHAKDKGRGNFQFFSEDLNQRNQRRHHLENGLRQAIINKEFELYYQAQINSRNNEIIGAEALIRWNNPERGLISPFEFIPIAEQNGLIIDIGIWVFKEVCSHINKCLAQGKSPIPIAINLSAVQFNDEGLVDMIESILKEEQLPTKWIEFEITESAIMDNADKAIKILEKLSFLGIRISIDDFGTGYSSLAYLKKFPVDKLKIDCEFIKELPNNKDDIILTTTMIMLANSLGLDVLAEGAETKEQVEFLSQHGCHLIQGYFFSKPLPAEEFIAYASSLGCNNDGLY